MRWSLRYANIARYDRVIHFLAKKRSHVGSNLQRKRISRDRTSLKQYLVYTNAGSMFFLHALPY